MKKDIMELKVNCVSENESFVRTVVAAFAARMDPTLDELSEVKTAVSEAVTNAVIHSGLTSEDSIYIYAQISAGVFEVVVCDEGRGIANIEQARQPFFTTQPDKERSGMGFTMMEAFMDNMRVVSQPGGGTSVTMSRQLGAKAEIA